MEEYTKEFFWNVYKTLPEELKEAIFDEKNNQIIYNICSNLGLEEEQSSIVAKYTGRVLMGLLPLNDFGITLELELNVNESLANKITEQIDLNIFKHLRLALSRLEEQKPGYRHISQIEDKKITFASKPETTKIKEPNALEKNPPEQPNIEYKLSEKDLIKFPPIKSLASYLIEKKPTVSPLNFKKPEPPKTPVISLVDLPKTKQSEPIPKIKESLELKNIEQNTPTPQISKPIEEKNIEPKLENREVAKASPPPQSPVPPTNPIKPTTTPESKKIDPLEKPTPTPIRSEKIDPYREPTI